MARLLIGLFVAALMSLSSCQFTEKVYVNEDGSGNMDFEIDLGLMMKTMQEKKGAPAEGVEPKPAEDTIMFMSQIMELKKDSIAKLSPEVRASLKKVSDMNMRVKLHSDESKNELVMNYLLDFKSVSQLTDFENALGTGQSVEKGKDNTIPSKSNTVFSFDGTTLNRKVVSKKMNEEEQAAYDESIQSMSMFFEGSTYGVEYHFPRAIKSTTAKGAKYSDDKKTLYISKSWKEVIDSPEILDFEVVLVK